MNSVDEDIAINEIEGNKDFYARSSKHAKNFKYFKTIVWVGTYIAIVVMFFENNWLLGNNLISKLWVELEMIAFFLELPFFVI